MIDFLSQANYLPLIIGLFFGGTPALVGAMLLAVGGKLDMGILMIITITCTLVWDAIWYGIGRFIPIEKVEQWSFLKSRQAMYKRFYSQYANHKHKLLFISRFVYGMNSLFSVVCGIMRMRPYVFLSLSAVSMTVWFIVIYIISFVFQTNAEIAGISDNLKIFIPFTLITMLAILWGIKKLAFKYFITQDDMIDEVEEDNI